MSRPVQPTTTETYGLPPEAEHLIAKLRQMPPELLALVMNTSPKDTK